MEVWHAMSEQKSPVTREASALPSFSWTVAHLRECLRDCVGRLSEKTSDLQDRYVDRYLIVHHAVSPRVNRSRSVFDTQSLSAPIAILLLLSVICARALL